MDDLLVKLVEQQTSMAQDIGEIKVSLVEHVRRTDIAEENIALLRSDMTSQLAPVKSHIVLINNALKLIGALGFIVGLIAGIVEIIAYISKLL